MGSSYGVCESQVSGRAWHIGIKVPGLSYRSAGQRVTIEAPRAWLQLGSEGDRVASVQSALRARGFGALSVDGRYGDQTAAAVRAFQERHGELPDGEVGPATLKALGLVV